MMEYTREDADMPAPGLNEDETMEFYGYEVDAMMYGEHSMSPEKLERHAELHRRIIEALLNA